jgi:hypothetical protein
MNRSRLTKGARLLALLATSGTAFALALATPAATTAAGPHICKGTQKKPGVLKGGTYPSGVIVKGLCEVNAGRAHVDGTLVLDPHSVLLAAFANNDRTHHGASGLTVSGSVSVEKGATLVLGCNHSSFPCFDDPNQSHPTLDRAGRVSGSVIAMAPLGVLIHQGRIGGSITQTGGGGGLKCVPEGAFHAFHSPVYSDLEDSTVHGSVTFSKLRSCWLGTARDKVGGALKFISDKLADPDAVEILNNTVSGSLVCRSNSKVWDSTEASMGSLYPRIPEPNTVHGKRRGQCRLASPVAPGAPPGPGPF